MWKVKKLPELQCIRNDVIQFVNKQKWKWVHRQHTHPQSSIRIPGMPTPACRELIDPTLGAWLGHFQHTMMKSCLKAINITKRRGDDCTICFCFD